MPTWRLGKDDGTHCRFIYKQKHYLTLLVFPEKFALKVKFRKTGLTNEWGSYGTGRPSCPASLPPPPPPPFSKGSLGINVNSWIVPAGIAIRDGEDDGGCWRWSPPHNLPSSSPPPAPPPSSIYPPPSPRILPLFWEIYLDERISLSLSLALSSRAHHPFS